MNDFDSNTEITIDNDDTLSELFSSPSNVIISSDEDTNTLSSDNFEYVLSLRRDEIEDEKDLKKFIRKCEVILRASPEYKDWISYIRDVMSIGICEITNESTDEVSCEIHHHPISLYTWVEAIVNKKLHNGEKFCSFDIAMELIEYHYNMKVPFCSIIKSLHEKFHKGFMEIPMEIVHGDYNFFVKEFGHYLDEESIDLITNRMKINKDNCGWEKCRWIKEI